ncbi:MAG: lycopene cyclase domain-containing protein [Candidatus Omnitrophica bacterium]|nr:lycopene cyclase domain-containing protein [Candidatus Omnitrophota bacterium]MCF7894289.1 lycopene cyclase domain-containing protein [Candidatus Omnitrophota bacterium]
MKEYTLISLGSIVITFLLEKLLKTGLFKKIEYYIYLIFIMAAELIVNGLITSKGIVKYNSDFYLGIKVGSIPVEDFFFGFSMVTTTIMFWEFFKRRLKQERSYE